MSEHVYEILRLANKENPKLKWFTMDDDGEWTGWSVKPLLQDDPDTPNCGWYNENKHSYSISILGGVGDCGIDDSWKSLVDMSK